MRSRRGKTGGIAGGIAGGLAACVAMLCGPAGAQTSPPPDLNGLQSTADQIQRFGPWERQSPYFERSMARLWADNGWRDEPDDFAYQTLREIVRIPPWQFMERFDALTQGIQRRYGLTEQQTNDLKGSLAREAGALFIKHGAVIARQINEQINMRTEGMDDDALMAGLRADMVRWTRETEGLHADAMAAIDRVTGAFAAGLNEEQRKQFEKDRKTLGKMTQFADHVRQEAREGRFKPELLGFDASELSKFMREPRAPAPGDSKSPAAGAAAKPAIALVRTDPATWQVYVRQFGERFKLDAAQIEAAESIRAELVERAQRYLAAHQAEVAAIEPRLRDEHSLLRPVIDLFENMKTRLDAIPRREQREAGGDPKPDRGKGSQP